MQHSCKFISHYSEHTAEGNNFNKKIYLKKKTVLNLKKNVVKKFKMNNTKKLSK